MASFLATLYWLNVISAAIYFRLFNVVVTVSMPSMAGIGTTSPGVPFAFTIPSNLRNLASLYKMNVQLPRLLVSGIGQ